ncbi:MAG: hypothetical protein G01um1014106_224 [Parcubacteria group bacterium Gr01-1014_106]|nr:MAG: hypothetical protein G01um1014106_224 [Parcubacteria group bacterium Gr01-1014_106]
MEPGFKSPWRYQEKIKPSLRRRHFLSRGFEANFCEDGTEQKWPAPEETECQWHPVGRGEIPVAVPERAGSTLKPGFESPFGLPRKIKTALVAVLFFFCVHGGFEGYSKTLNCLRVLETRAPKEESGFDPAMAGEAGRRVRRNPRGATILWRTVRTPKSPHKQATKPGSNEAKRTVKTTKGAKEIQTRGIGRAC